MPSTEQDFKARDAGSYDEHADRFDGFVRRFSIPIIEPMLQLAGLQDGSEAIDVLDVGTGTGIIAFAAADTLGPQARITGVDLSDGMLATATRKAEQAANGRQLSFRKMDAESLDLEDNRFDAVLSLYALRHFPNPKAALTEMRRVLKPGGKLVVGVGSGPALLTGAGVRAGLHRLRDTWLRSRGKQLLACAHIDALVEQYLPVDESSEEAEWTHQHGHFTESVPDLFRQAGFDRVVSRWAGQRALIGSAEEFWDIQVTFSSIARKRTADADPAQVEKLKQAFIDSANRVLDAGGELLYPTGALIVAAQR